MSGAAPDKTSTGNHFSPQIKRIPNRNLVNLETFTAVLPNTGTSSGAKFSFGSGNSL